MAWDGDGAAAGEASGLRDPDRSQLLIELFQEHGARLRRLFQRRGHSLDAAADLQQEVFLRLATCDLDLLAARPGQMVYRIARFVSIDAHRRGRLEQTLGLATTHDVMAPDLPDGAPTQDLKLEWRQELQTTLAAFAALPPRGGRALWLARVGELSHREIATLQGVSPRTVEHQIAAAAARLRALLRSSGPATA